MTEFEPPSYLKERLMERINDDREQEIAFDLLKKTHIFSKSQEAAVKLKGRVVSFREEGFSIVPNVGLYLSEMKSAKTAAYIAIVWDEKIITASTDPEEYGARAVIIEAFSNGNLVVHGNAIGSTILSAEDLKNRRMQNTALKKALNNPHRIAFFQEKPSSLEA